MPRPTRASGLSTSRSATSRSTRSSAVASAREEVRLTSWPAAVSIPSTLLPSSRSDATARTRATASERAALAELFAHALRPTPHLHDLGAALAQLTHLHLAGDSFGVELRQH